MDQIKLLNALSLFLETTDVNIDDSLVSLGFDSLRIVELIVYLEDEFDITFNDSDLVSTNFTTVNDLYFCIKKHF